MDHLFLEAYKESCENFKTAMFGLQASYQHCQTIGIKDSYTFEESEAFDALIIKLSRNIDVFFQQIIKGFFKLKGENELFFIDKINRLEQMKIINNIDVVFKLKSFRNQAVHEYSVVAFEQLYKEAIQYTENLTILINDFFDYLKNDHQFNNFPQPQ